MKKIILVSWVLFTTYFVHSQTTIASSGGTAAGSTGISTYTIGQIVYTTHNQNNGSLVQGVQQPFEFQVLSTVDISSTNLTLFAYPNPTSDNLILNVSDKPLDKLEYTLFDIQGKQIIDGLITKTKTTIKIQYLANGVYFLKVNKNNLLLKVLKIIKK